MCFNEDEDSDVLDLVQVPSGFTDPQIAYLQAEAKRLGISVSDLIRRIIDQHRSSMSS